MRAVKHTCVYYWWVWEFELCNAAVQYGMYKLGSSKGKGYLPFAILPDASAMYSTIHIIRGLSGHKEKEEERPANRWHLVIS